MPQQFKLSDILNIVSIGVLFQLIFVKFLHYLYPKQVNDIILYISTKELSGVFTIVSLILAFPIWRLISEWVEFIMFVPARQGNSTLNRLSFFIKSCYRLVFFLLTKNKGLNNSVDFHQKFAEDSIISDLTRKNIEKVFNLQLVNIKSQDYRQLFYLIKSFTSINNTSSGADLYSSRYNMVFNYHTRLAIVFHISTFLSLILLLLNFRDNIGSWRILGIQLVVFYGLTGYFSRTSILYGERELDLLIHDFNATCASKIGIQA